MRAIASLIAGIAIASVGQQSSPRPTFAQYAAATMFHGTPASPRLVTKDQRLFRTMIRTGGQDNGRFAGHYTVAEWGCGSDCSQYAVIDLITGAVSGPFTVSGLPWSWLESHRVGELEHVEFKPTSRLLKVNGCPDEHNCGFYDYVVEKGAALKLIRKEVLPQEYQLEP